VLAVGDAPARRQTDQFGRRAGNIGRQVRGQAAQDNRRAQRDDPEIVASREVALAILQVIQAD